MQLELGRHLVLANVHWPSISHPLGLARSTFHCQRIDASCAGFSVRAELGRRRMLTTWTSGWGNNDHSVKYCTTAVVVTIVVVTDAVLLPIQQS